MPVVDIPFPRTSLPGQRPGEGQGRLVNCFCEMDAEVPVWRPAFGLASFADLGATDFRGGLDMGGTLYAAVKDRVVSVGPDGGVTVLTGSLPGTDLVTFARNNKAPTPDVLVVGEQGAYQVTSSAVSPFVDVDLPQPTSVRSLDGYLLVTIGDGRIFASGLNDTAFSALAFATCQSSPDGLLTGTVSGQLFYGWGSSTVEVWQDVGTTPFPLSRVSVIPVGLLSRFAVAGFENGWDRQQIFVAADGTVRRLMGVEPQLISTKDVDRAIAAVPDKSTLVASVYVAGGHPIWSLTSPLWTWEYNTTTDFWHERQSLFLPRWRGRGAVKFGTEWVVGDTESTNLLRVSENVFTENGAVIPMTIESGPGKQFPSRLLASAAFFDWTVGQGALIGVEDVTEPQVAVSWSHDGGGSWAEPLMRPLGMQGQFHRQVRVNRCGLTTHHGIRFRLITSSPVYRTLRGGRVELAERRSA